MKRYDLNTLADSVFRDEAIAAIDRLAANGLPDKKDFWRTQMKQLQLVARDEPLQVRNYAKHQLEKQLTDKQKNYRNPEVASIWETAMNCCEPSGVGSGWSIQSAAKPFFESGWSMLEMPIPKGASVEERQARNKLKAGQTAFIQQWTRDVTPVFFDFFCVEYIFRISEL